MIGAQLVDVADGWPDAGVGVADQWLDDGVSSGGKRHFSYNILQVIFGILCSTISLYLRFSVPTLLTLKSTFVDLKCVQFFLRCPKARMHSYDTSQWPFS